jgi:hypothetical protein
VTRPRIGVMLPGMKIFDRVLTIVITATLTCAIWIVFG